jgi:dimethylglycine dehydrogenase
MGFGMSGVESPLVFLPDSKAPINQCKLFDFEWAPLAAAETAVLLQGVGVSHASYSKFYVTGPAAKDFLSYLTTNVMPKLGTTRLTYATTPTGKVFAEFSVACVGDAEFYLVGSRDYHEFDCNWLRTYAGSPEWTGRVEVLNVTENIEILHACGPQTLALLASFADVADIPFLGFKDVTMFGMPVRCFRMSFSGLHGMELHCKQEHASQVLELLLTSDRANELGLALFGGHALNSLRVEVGFKIRGDMDYAHYSEAGLGPFIAKSKRDTPGSFLGQDPSIKPTRIAAFFTVDTAPGCEWSVVGDCPVRRLDTNALVGFTTTAAAAGRAKNGTVALGFVLLDNEGREQVDPSDPLYLESYGQKWTVHYLTAPPVKVTGAKPWNAF